MKQKIENWIQEHKEEMLADIKTLVNIRSVASEANEEGPYGSGCRKALNKMLELGNTYGFTTYDYDGYGGEISFGEGEKEVAFWGHLDVVPEGSDWQYEPYDMHRVKDFIIGRGVQDNKGPLVCAFYTLRYLKEVEKLPMKCRLIFGCDEEKGMDDIPHILERCRIPDLSLIADCSFPVCRGEKGGLNLDFYKKIENGMIQSMAGGIAVNNIPDKAEAVVKSGHILEKVYAQGIAGHAAFPEHSCNAIGKLCENLLDYPLNNEESAFVSFLAKAAGDGWGIGLGIEEEDVESGRLTCNLGILEMCDEQYHGTLDIRYPVTCDSQEILEKLKLCSAEQGFELKVSGDAKPYCWQKDNPMITELLAVYTEITGKEAPAYVMGGGTYAKKIPHALGFGPGMDQPLEQLNFQKGHGQCHSADEAQYIPNLCTAVSIYATALIRLAKSFSRAER